MYYDIDLRAIKEAEYVLAEKATVRKTATKFSVSKSTVHYDLTRRLKKLDEDLYEEVKRVLFVNLCERHIRGGIATREKYKERGKRGKS